MNSILYQKTLAITVSYSKLLRKASTSDSLLRDLEDGMLNRILSLFAAGFICGFLWEFWNYWAP